VESLTIYQAILTNINEPVYVRDLDKNLIYINPALEKLAGWSLKDAQGKKCYQVLGHSEQTCLQSCPAERLIAEQLSSLSQNFTLNNTLLGPRDMHVSVSPLQNEQGQSIGAVVVMEDITERVQAEMIQRQRVSQLAMLNEIGGQIAAELELDAVFGRAAQLVQESFGYHHVAIFIVDQDQDTVTMHARAGAFADLFPPSHEIEFGQGMVGSVAQNGEKLLANDVISESRYINFLPQVISTQAELTVPIRIGAETVGVLDVQSPRCNAFDDNDVMVIETLADQIAVAYKNAHLYQALQASEEWYRTIAENTQDGLTIIENGEVIYVNGRACEIFGYPQDELCCLTDLDFSPPKDNLSQAWSQRIADQLDEQPVEQEFWIERKDGSRRCVHNRYSVIRRDGSNTYRLVVTTDITKRKQMTQQMLRAERLAAMGYVSSTLAHEIKNPLQAIHSNLELVLEYPLEPQEQEEYLRLCEHEVENLVEITQRVLSFASANRTSYQAIHINDLLQQTLKLLQKTLQKANVETCAQLASNLPPISAAPDQITQVLLNLFINMLEAMFKGGTITIAGRIEESDTGEMLVLTLQNDGPSIPPEHIDHIFEPFFTTKPDGAGLGLFISHNIVRQHGGSLAAENLPDDSGVRFTLALPVAPKHAQEALVT